MKHSRATLYTVCHATRSEKENNLLDILDGSVSAIFRQEEESLLKGLPRSGSVLYILVCMIRLFVDESLFTMRIANKLNNPPMVPTSVSTRGYSFSTGEDVVDPVSVR